MFIRTKDGRIVDTEKEYEPLQWAEQARDYALTIAQADTIEDLCDEFVLLERNAKPIIFKTLRGAINNKIYNDENIYGCIWCEFGLKYVAKMNEKGELELL